MATAQDKQLFPDWLTQSKVTPIVQQVELLSRPALTARLNSALRFVPDASARPGGLWQKYGARGLVPDAHR